MPDFNLATAQLSGHRIMRGTGGGVLSHDSGPWGLVADRFFDPAWCCVIETGIPQEIDLASGFPDMPNFVVTGTNSADGNITFNSLDGGMRFAAGLLAGPVDGDQCIARGVVGSLAGNVMHAQLQPFFVADLRFSTGTTPSALHTQNMRLFSGLKLTSTDVETTDADQAYISFDANATTAGAWRTISSVSNVDTVRIHGSGGPVAGRRYTLAVFLDSSRRAHFYLNNARLRVSDPLLSTLNTLKPCFGIALRGAAVSKVMVVGQLAYGFRRDINP
jgi:hypothetical protein